MERRFSWAALVCLATCASCGATDDDADASGGASSTGGRSDSGGSSPRGGSEAGDATSATGGDDSVEPSAGQAGRGAGDGGSDGEASSGAAGAVEDAEGGSGAGQGGASDSGGLGGSGGEPAPPTYPECEPGKVYSGSWKACLSEDLERLRGVTTFEGTLYIDRNCNAVDLEPLRCLERVDGLLSIDTDVESLDFMRGLETVTGSLFIDSTSDVILPNLVSVGEDLLLNGREASLDCPKLVSVGSMLRFGGAALIGASLPELVSVGGALALSSASGLEHFPDFPKLTRANYLSLENNGVADLRGLEQLRVLELGLHIAGNRALRDLRGLVGLERVGSFSVVDNPALPTCEAEWLRDRLTITDGVGIADNDDDGECP